MIFEKFEELTLDVWLDVYHANQYNLNYGEETITDSILLKIARENYFQLRILQTPKWREREKGTDWEWFVGSYDYGWVRYAIQAKKMNVGTSRYDSLNHRVGTPPNDDYQINILRAFSDLNGAIPLYTFYNYFPSATAEHWHCHREFDKEMLGWTFTPLMNVERAVRTHGSRTFDKIHRFPETLPVRCLFKCPYFLSIYEHTPIDDEGDFYGESFKKIMRLPKEFITAREIGILKNFPQELYKPNIEIYPRRIAIIDIGESFNQVK